MSKSRISQVLAFAGTSGLALVLGCSSAGGAPSAETDGGGLSSGPDPTEGGAPQVVEDAGGNAPVSYTLLDDMERADQFATWAPPGSTGFWSTHTDPAQVDSISPGATWSYSAVPTPYETFPGITSTHAARFRTLQPLVNTFGGSMGLAFVDATRAAAGDFSMSLPVDLTKYRGLTFWAMADQSEDATILLELFDKNTYPSGGVCTDSDGGTANCYNGFGTTLTLTGAFTQYTVDFSTLAQDPTWGFQPLPDVPDLENTYVLVVQVNTPAGAASVTFDVWIDNLYLIDK